MTLSELARNPTKITKRYVIQHADTIDWLNVCGCVPVGLLYELSEDFSDMFDWFFVSIRMDLTAEFIRKHSDKLEWENISYFSKIEVISSLVDEFYDKISLSELSMRADASSDLYDKISRKQELHESN